MKKGLVGFVLANIVVCLAIVFGTVSTVHAISYYTDKDALPLAPIGIPIGNLSDDDLFKAGAGSDDMKPKIYENNSSMILLTGEGSPSGVTSVWANKEQDNYIDITQKQTLTAWLYFGGYRASTDAGAEGMALVLQNSGYDAIARTKSGGDVAGGESLGVWGSDKAVEAEGGIITQLYDLNTAKSTLNDMAKSALQKSFALEFDTHRNGGKSSSELGTNGSNFDSYQLNYQDTGGARSTPDQHAAYGYPAAEEMYYKSGYNSYPVSVSIFEREAEFPFYLLNHRGIEEQDFANNNSAGDSWHHITITYNPATATSKPTLTYVLNDKLIDGRAQGSGSTGQAEYDNKVELDMSQFGTIKDNKLYYGFTGATAASEPSTEAIVFESMPSIVQMEANAYIVNKTTNSKISNNTDFMDDETLKLDDTEKAHPGDDLRFNYLLQYESGKQQSKDVVETIEVPEGVSVVTDNDIGKIYYSGIDNATGNKVTKSVDIDRISYDPSTRKVKVAIEDMGKTDDNDIYWETARVELKTTADKIPDGQTKTTVPVGHAAISGSNYVTDTETPQFDVVNPSDTLILTKTKGDGDYKSKDLVSLEGNMEYGSKKTLDPKDVTMIYQVDNDEEIHAIDTDQPASGTVPFFLKLESLSEGEHTITVKAVSKANDDIISSNVLTYNVNIDDRELIITPDNQNRTVDDDGIQKITGTIKFSDGAKVSPNFTKMYGYLIDGKGNEQTPTLLNGSTIDYEYNSDNTEAKYTIELKPIGYQGLGNVNPNSTKGLTEGENNYTIAFSISAMRDDSTTISTYKEDVNYKINVPELKISLSNEGHEDITALKINDLKLPATLNYSDPDHKFSPRYMSSQGYMDGIISNGSVISNDINDYSNVTGEYKINNGMGLPISGSGFDKNKKEFAAEYYVLDPYLRKSNTVYYNVKIITKYVQLTTGKNYSFGQHVVDPEITDYIRRSGDWNLSVDSVMSQWKLTASATNFVRNNANGGIANILDGNMVYIDPNNENNISTLNTGSNGNPVEIAEQDEPLTATTDISSSWGDETGILLDMNSAAIKGSYTSTISWNLTDSI
ncbi:hypothetical protein [Companilactobacillus sp. HBUAS59699]|uniref:hypothetical protein n=1 Tax=Companilactobacillus sp. HBUAS59699 TaxID=3109358 RepID=UPI002FF239D5